MAQKNYNVTGTERKALVNKVAELTGENPVYLGMPTVSFKVGPFEISRTGILRWEDWADEAAKKLTADLKNAGFVAEGEEDTATEKIPTEELTPEEDTAPSEETEQAEGTALSISIPDDMTDTQFALLLRLVQGKETLLKHAFNTDDLNIVRENGKITFPWFEASDGEHTKAYTLFVTMLKAMAKKAKRVVVHDKPVENEKFSFRVFLIRLGMIGDDYKEARKILLENLTGNSAWKSGHKPEKAPETTA